MNYRWTHLIGYMILLFLWPTINSSQRFTAGTASTPLHISVFTFSPLICKHGDCECSSSSRPATKFRSSGGQWWNANSILLCIHWGIKRWKAGVAGAGMDILEKSELSCSCRESNHDSSVMQAEESPLHVRFSQCCFLGCLPLKMKSLRFFETSLIIYQSTIEGDLKPQ
jgi:hypothetical protein